MATQEHAVSTELFAEQDHTRVNQEADSPTSLSRRGPPNRMNDLVYRDWMKFQKSFFRHTSYKDLIRESIAFFTKAKWPDGQPSRTLILGFSLDPADVQEESREIALLESASLGGVIQQLEHVRDTRQKYDFVFVNLAPFLRSVQDLSTFLEDWSDHYFELLRSVVSPERYCGMVVDLPGPGGSGFPIPWSVGLAGRNHLRLRDEKIGLIESENRLYYCIFMQSTDDARPASCLSPATLLTSQRNGFVIPWVMPKSPPRKKEEIYHPAKFPESLIEQFICTFTQPGESVLDPMVGTGSAVLAAIKVERNGVGIDLNEEFVQIAQRRVQEAQPPVLFEEFQSSAKGTIIQGDATCLDTLPGLQNQTFAYCVTSPPYWSMLSNPGSENQRARRERNLPLVYSEHANDLGNTEDYGAFLDLLVTVYNKVAMKLRPGGHLTVVVKNVKRNHILYPLAWDLTERLCMESGQYEYVGTTLWCQDDVGIKPFAVGIYWVSNILHHYCLHFQRRDLK